MAYATNFLKQVILRLDFVALAALQSERPQPLTEQIKAVYPHVKGSQISQVIFTWGAGIGAATPEQQKAGWQWLHSDSEDDNKRRIVSLTPNYLALEYKGEGLYTNFVEFRDRFSMIYDKFIKSYGVPEYSRIGLRYINEITIPEGEALDWDGLLAADLATGVKPGFAKSLRMTRSMHQVTGIKDDISCLINYGMHNPDFPNPIVRRQFVLDIDSSVDGLIAETEAKRKIDSLYDVGRDIFEASIGTELRQRMGN